MNKDRKWKGYLTMGFFTAGALVLCITVAYARGSITQQAVVQHAIACAAITGWITAITLYDIGVGYFEQMDARLVADKARLQVIFDEHLRKEARQMEDLEQKARALRKEGERGQANFLSECRVTHDSAFAGIRGVAQAIGLKTHPSVREYLIADSQEAT